MSQAIKNYFEKKKVLSLKKINCNFRLWKQSPSEIYSNRSPNCEKIPKNSTDRSKSLTVNNNMADRTRESKI